jgi:hypothetical protein
MSFAYFALVLDILKCKLKGIKGAVGSMVKVSSHLDSIASLNMKYLLAATSLALASTALAQRTITVYNACPFTIWYVMCFLLSALTVTRQMQARSMFLAVMNQRWYLH